MKRVLPTGGAKALVFHSGRNRTLTLWKQNQEGAHMGTNGFISCSSRRVVSENACNVALTHADVEAAVLGTFPELEDDFESSAVPGLPAPVYHTAAKAPKPPVADDSDKTVFIYLDGFGIDGRPQDLAAILLEMRLQGGEV